MKNDSKRQEPFLGQWEVPIQVQEAHNQNNKDKSVSKQMRRIVKAENIQINNPLIRYVVNK